MTDIVFLILLIIHVSTVVLWMGALILLVSVLAPGLTKLSPASRTDFLKTIAPRLTNYFIRNATVALVAGLILYLYIKGLIVSVSPSLAPSPSGEIAIQAGIGFGLLAYIIGVAITARAQRRLIKLLNQALPPQAGGAGPPPEMATLQKRIMIGSGLSAVLLGLALLTMLVGANI